MRNAGYSLDGNAYSLLENVGDVTQIFLSLPVSQVGADPAMITFKVKAGNADGEFGDLSDNAGTVRRAPRKPAIRLTEDVLSIDIDWSGLENPTVPRFDLFGADSGDSLVFLASITDGRRTYRDGGLADETEREYQIRAHGPCYNEAETAFAGDTAYSDTEALEPYPVDSEFPEPPENFAVALHATDSTTTVVLTWTPVPDSLWGDNATDIYYLVERSRSGTVSGGWNSAGTPGLSSGNPGTFSDTGRSPGNLWYYRISAWGLPDEYESAYSEPVAIRLAGGQPGAPGGFVAAEAGTDAMDLTWTWMAADSGGTRLSEFTIEFQEDPLGSTWQVAENLTWSGNVPVTRFRHNGLKENTEYHYRIRAVNAAGTGEWVDGVSGTTGQAPVLPDPPTGLRATADGDSAIDLTWEVPRNTGSSPLTGFVIQVAEDPTAASPWSRLDSIGPAETTFEHGGLAPGTTRFYRVFATNDVGRSVPSDTATATTENPMAPSAPRNLTAAAVGDSAIDLTWELPQDTGTSAVTGFVIEAAADITAASPWSKLDSVGPAETTFKHGGLAPGATRYYRVFATNDVGRSVPSDTATATTENPMAPSAPRNLTAAAVGDSAIDLTWELPQDTGTSAVTGFVIEAAADITAASPWSKLDSVGPAETTFKHGGLAPGATRFYRVFATNDEGRSSPSNMATARTENPMAPSAPRNLTALAVGEDAVDLAWEAPQDTGTSAIESYRVQVFRGNTWVDLAIITDPSNLSFRHGGLTANTEYRYRVLAVNEVGDGTPAEVRVTTEGDDDGEEEKPRAPGAPRNLDAVEDADSAIDLEWEAPADTGTSAVTGYQVEVSPKNTSSWRLVDTVLVSTYRYRDVEPETRYYFRVYAINAAGRSDASNRTSATTEEEIVETSLPGVPRALTAEATSREQIYLDWEKPEDDGGSEIVGYLVEVSENGGVSWRDLVENTGSADTRYRDRDLRPGTTRHYRVGAINDIGIGDPSNVASATTPGREPDSPADLAATAIGATGLALSWSAPAFDGGSPITGYRIERSVDGGGTWTVLAANTGSAGTSYSDDTLDPGTTRHYRVYAINEHGTSPASNVAFAKTDATVPGVPRNLVAVADGTSQIDLKWVAPEVDGGSPVIGYRILVSTADNLWVALVDNTGTGSTAYSHEGLDPATTRSYQVLALNEIGVGPSSNIATATTQAVPPDPPTGLTATANGPHQIDLEWTVPEFTGGVPVTGYMIEVHDGSVWILVEEDTRSAASKYQHGGLEPGSTRRYRVSAINEVGTSEPSNVVAATTDPVVPGVPTSVQAVSRGPDVLAVSWRAPEYNGGADITGYRIEGLRTGGQWTVVVENTRSAATGYHHRGLMPASTWHYRVSAINQAGAGEASEIASGTTDPVAPDPPTDLRAEADGISQINLSWAEPAYDGGARVTGYRVEVSDDAGSSWITLVQDTRSRAGTYQHAGLPPASTRHYRVSAINRAGTSEPSRVASATTDATVPDHPARLRAVAVDHARIDLAWEAPGFDGGAAVTGYRIEYSRDGGATWIDQTENTRSRKTNHSHTELVPATTYHYRVSAINEMGVSRATDPVSARTHATVPDAPTALEAIASEPTRIDLVWRAPEYDGGAAVSSYRVEVSDEGDAWTDLESSTGTNGTAYSHTGLRPGATKHYRVSAINEAGMSDPSNEAFASTDDPVERTERVNVAILPRFAAAVTSGIVEMVSRRVTAVAEGRADHAGGVNLRQNRGAGLRDLLNGSSVSRSLGGGVATWASFRLTSMGEPNASAVQWDGDMSSVHVGSDIRLPGNMLAGLSASRASGRYDFTDNLDAREVAGSYETRMTNFTPYVAWTPRDRISLWAAGSYGRGDLEIDDEIEGARGTNTTMTTWAGGLSSRLLSNGSGALSFRSEGWSSTVETDQSAQINALAFGVRRVRAALEWAQTNRFESGHEVGLLLNSGVRYDMNEGVEDVNGMEFGGGLRYRSPSGRVKLDGSGRMLVATDSDYEEWGIGGMIQIDPGDDGGLGVNLNTSYGNAMSDVRNIWDNGITSRVGTTPQRTRLALLTEYRFPTLKTIPYGRMDLVGGQQRLVLGTRFQSLLDLLLEGTYSRDGTGLALKGGVSFD